MPPNACTCSMQLVAEISVSEATFSVWSVVVVLILEQLVAQLALPRDGVVVSTTHFGRLAAPSKCNWFRCQVVATTGPWHYIGSIGKVEILMTGNRKTTIAHGMTVASTSGLFLTLWQSGPPFQLGQCRQFHSDFEPCKFTVSNWIGVGLSCLYTLGQKSLVCD